MSEWCTLETSSPKSGPDCNAVKSALIPQFCFILYPVSPLPQQKVSQTFEQSEDSLSREHSENLRRILLLALGGLLLLLTLSGLDAWVSVRKLGRIEQEINRRFAAHSQALSAIIISVHVYDDQMEQYLLGEEKTAQVPQAFDPVGRSAEIHAALLQYPLDQEPEEQLLLKELERRLAEQENSFAAASAWSGEERHQRAHQFIGKWLIPQRIHILQVSEEISLLNRRKLGAEKEALAANFRSVQARLQRMVVLALTAGVLLSIVSGLYILRLERQGRRRYLTLMRSRQELEELSARLVEVQEQERRDQRRGCER